MSVIFWSVMSLLGRLPAFGLPSVIVAEPFKFISN